MSSTLVITLRRDPDDDVVRLIAAGPGITAFAPLDPVDEFLLADVLRHVDRIAFGENPGPCERWLARTEQEDGAA